MVSIERSSFGDVLAGSLLTFYSGAILAFFIKSWHVAVNLFSDMPMVYITLWR
jgi:hypothetical protein